MKKYYIVWNDGDKSGFVDYEDDFVTDNLEERAVFFDSEQSANEHILQLQQRILNCCRLTVALFGF